MQTEARESTIPANPPPEKPLNLGEWCILTGAASAAQVQECLDLQRSCHEQGKSAPRLGELLVARGYVSPELIAEALSNQGRQILSCPRCRLRVNVPRRPDAVGYECARCHGPLQTPSDPGDLSATDHPVIVKSRDPLPPDVCEAARDPENLFGKYILLKEIGRGGMGHVFLAWDTFLCQKVALKRVRRDVPEECGAGDGGGETLMREARNAIRLRHPGIVSLFDVGREGRDTYISMEYVEGHSLDEELRQARVEGFVAPYHRNPERTLRALADVAHALHYAHTSPAPVVHCDLKPGNIMIDPQGRPHLLDFGLAHRMESPKTGERDVAGTPNYMAPEQAAGWTWEIDARTDVYGLGAVLYELLTGRPPFLGDPLGILQRVLKDVPVLPSRCLKEARVEEDPGREKVREIPAFLQELCMRCLEKDKARRPQTMLEVAQVLEQAARAQRPAQRATLIVPPAPRRARRLALHVAAAAATAILAFSLGAVLARGPRPAAPADADRIGALLGAFRPEAVPPDAPPALREEAARVESIRTRILRRLERTSLAFEELRLRERTLREARILRADRRGIDVRTPDLSLRVAWTDLEPSQVLLLARESGVEGDAEGLLALGTYCLRAGRRMDAKEYLGKARSAPHGPLAESSPAAR